MAINNAINSPVVGGIATLTSNAVLLGNGAGVIGAAAAFSADGQLLIGNGVSAPAVATLTAGDGVSIVNGAGTITISSGVNTYSVVSGTTQTMVAGASYLAVNNGATAFTLPATAAQGTVMKIVSAPANGGGFTIAQAAGQKIQLGNVASTPGTGGSFASTSSNGGDALTLVCSVANTTWVAVNNEGNFTIV